MLYDLREQIIKEKSMKTLKKQQKNDKIKENRGKIWKI